MKLLLQQGRKVRVFDLNDADDRPAQVEYQRGDIRDLDACRAACSGAEAVFHCVAQVPLAKDSVLFWSVNRDGTRNLLQAARDMNVRKVVYTSSSAVFGVPERVPPDHGGHAPASLVGATSGLAKLALARRFGHEFEPAKGLDVSIIRPRTIMGHGRLGIMQIVFEWVTQGRNVFVLGKGNNRFQFVHSDDLADACILASGRVAPGVRHIQHRARRKQFGTMRETLEGLVRHAGTGSKVRSLPYGPTVLAMRLTNRLRVSPLATYHWLVYGKDVAFDLARPKAELGWSARWSNVEMFIQSYKDWYRENRERILAEKGSRFLAPFRRQGRRAEALAMDLNGIRPGSSDPRVIMEENAMENRSTVSSRAHGAVRGMLSAWDGAGCARAQPDTIRPAPRPTLPLLAAGPPR